jgi:hypothetical protein
VKKLSVRGFFFLALGFLAATVILFPGAHAADTGSTRIVQGETVYVNDVIDITSVVTPSRQFAYWDGYDIYDSPPTYILTLPAMHERWYHFYIDPAIFQKRLGAWYKYDSTSGFEKNANNLAFIVRKHDTVQVLPQTEIPTIVTSAVTSAPTPSPVPSTIPVFTRTTGITPTPTPGNNEKGDYALIISVIIVGSLFGFFTLIESKFLGRK